MMGTQEKSRDFEAVYVEWVDSRGSHDWCNLEEVRNFELALVKEIGFLMHQDKERLVLASAMSDSISPYTDEDLYHGIKSIPMSCVKRCTPVASLMDIRNHAPLTSLFDTKKPEE